MGFEDIRLAVESHLAAWPDAPVAFDNVPAQSSVQDAIDAKEPWVRLTIQHGASNIAALGSSPETRRTGLIQCQVFTAERIGTATCAQLADSLANYLQYYAVDKLETLAASVQRVGPSDGWFLYVVSVPWRAC